MLCWCLSEWHHLHVEAGERCPSCSIFFFSLSLQCDLPRGGVCRTPEEITVCPSSTEKVWCHITDIKSKSKLSLLCSQPGLDCQTHLHVWQKTEWNSSKAFNLLKMLCDAGSGKATKMVSKMVMADKVPEIQYTAYLPRVCLGWDMA